MQHLLPEPLTSASIITTDTTKLPAATDTTKIYLDAEWALCVSHYSLYYIIGLLLFIIITIKYCWWFIYCMTMHFICLL